MNETHIIIALVIVLVLFLIYKFWYSAKKAKPASKAKSKDTDKGTLDDVDPGDDSDFDEDEEDARELYKKFHHRFVNGITEEEFNELADDDDGILWLKLSQLYDLAKSQGMNPATHVRVAEYQKVL